MVLKAAFGSYVSPRAAIQAFRQKSGLTGHDNVAVTAARDAYW